MSNGKIIVIGGNDGTGKRTQATMLQEKLSGSELTCGKKAHMLSFPVYTSFWGTMVGRYLKKPECGEPLPEEISSDHYQAATLYELDRRAQIPMMLEVLDRGEWIVCDRYTESNMAHQTAWFLEFEAQDEFLRRLAMIQAALGILEADLTVILALSDDIRSRKVVERLSEEEDPGRVSLVDRHEQDADYMVRVNALYPLLANRNDWPIINCSGDDGKQLSREAIHDQVLQVVTTHFGN